MHPTRELAVLLIGLSVGSVITFALVRLIVPAWWRRQDRLTHARRTRRSTYR